MKLLTILTATLALVMMAAGNAKADSASDLQKLLTTNRCEGCDQIGRASCRERVLMPV